MIKNTFEVKQGIKAHIIQNELFKTNIICVLLTVPLELESVTKNALIPFLLRSGSKNYQSQLEINKHLEEMYGASFDCGIDKMGDNQILKFFIEGINDSFLPEKDNLLKEMIDLTLELVFNTNIKDGKFDEEILKIEKENLKQVIEGKIDDKDYYAYETCISKMYGESGFGLFKYGKLEDIEKIDSKVLADHYNKLIQTVKIDIFVSGNPENERIEEILKENENIKKLAPRSENYILNNEYTENKQKVDNVQEIKESMEVSQGKLVIGLDVLSKQENLQPVALVYNSILGDGANSMLFQNVREKASLAYSTKSKYIRQKANIFIRCGIEVENYDKALNLIKEQISNIANGNFTDEDIENAKCYLISGIRAIPEGQDSELIFYIGAEISKTEESLEYYIDKIQNVTREEIIEFAKQVQYNTIYFLQNDF